MKKLRSRNVSVGRRADAQGGSRGGQRAALPPRTAHGTAPVHSTPRKKGFLSRGRLLNQSPNNIIISIHLRIRGLFIILN